MANTYAAAHPVARAQQPLVFATAARSAHRLHDEL
jgi:hypothetical protein